MAHIYNQEGRLDKAIAEYKKLIQLDTEDYNSYSMLGDVYVKKGELAPAFDAYLVCSDAYIRLGQLEKAALVQSKIARLSPDALTPDNRKRQATFQKQVEGDKAMDAGDMDGAIAAYLAVLAMDRDRFDLYQKLGDLYLRKGETALACKKYLEIGDIYLQNKLIKKAAPIYLKVVELDPENVDAHAALADIQAKSGNESEAKKELLLLAEFLFMHGDLERCYQFAQKGEQLKSIESYNYLGHVELRRGKRAEAKVWFDKLLKFKLNHGGALWGLGLVLQEEGKADEALKIWAKVPASDRFYGETLASIAAAQEKQGLLKEAGQAYQDAAAALRSKNSDEAARAASAKANALLALVVPDAVAPSPSVAVAETPAMPSVAPPTMEAPVKPAMAAPAPLPPVTALPSVPLPPLPVLPTPTLAPLPAVPPLAAMPEDDVETLLALADNFEAEGAYDESIGVYQRILEQVPGNARAKEGLSRAYRLLAGGPVVQAVGSAVEAAEEQTDLGRLAALKAQAESDQAQAEEAGRKLAQARMEAEAQAKAAMDARHAETEAKLRAEIEARQRAEADAKRQAELASVQAEAMKKRLETEIRAQLEAEMRKQAEHDARLAAEVEIAHKVDEARRGAEMEARVKVEQEIRRQFEEERKKLEHEQSEVRRRLEGELRQQITAKVEVAQQAQTAAKVEQVRVVEEDKARQRQASEVLARVQAQQKEKMAPLQRTIDEIRRKVEEQAARNAGASASPAAPAPTPKPAAAKPVVDDPDEMDDFMTAAVADIYVKQGLVKEAQRIYERILKREPGNSDVRAKLGALQGKAAPATGPEAKASDPAKKSKVSYL